MQDKFTNLEKIAFSILFVVIILSVVFSIFAWINFLTNIDLMTAGIEMVGEGIYQLIN